MNQSERQEIEETIRTVIGAAYEVSNQLGAGFLERVYEQALLIELRASELEVESQIPLAVYYKGNEIAKYVADILVNGKVLVELKCVDRLTSDHMAQCINYLKATNLNICLLINFQRRKVEWKRIVNNLQFD